jgi:SAM-dependent methyltransferase
MEQRFASDEIANIYKTAGPDYPEALIEDVVAYADLKPNDDILEVGCGTGQATKSFAKRNFSVLAIDPGPEMLRGARESLADFNNVRFLEIPFEAWPAKQGEFRLIVAAQSWHWVSPEMRFVRAAEALSPEGSLAVFGHVPVGLPDPLLAQFKEIYLRHAGQWGRPPEAWYLPDGPFKGWFDQSKLFGPVAHKGYPWKWRHTTSSCIAFLRTKSEHRMLESAKREDMLGDC